LLSSTSSSIIENFIHSVVQSHEIATGLKKLTSHEQIIDYAYSKGFSFTKDDWDEFVLLDSESLKIPVKAISSSARYDPLELGFSSSFNLESYADGRSRSRFFLTIYNCNSNP